MRGRGLEAGADNILLGQGLGDRLAGSHGGRWLHREPCGRACAVKGREGNSS